MQALIDRTENLIFEFTLTHNKGKWKRLPVHLDYEDGKYRQGELAKIIRDAVVYFALTPSEFDDFVHSKDLSEANRMAWGRISKARKDKKGDYGEVLLFLILRRFFPNTERFVTKVRLRSSVKDQIKGFDCAHFTIEKENVVLWLGEAKFHKSFSTAISGAITSIEEHCAIDYLKDEMTILASNIELNKKHPYFDKLKMVFRGKSLDKVKFRIPVLLTYDSAEIKKHNSDATEEFAKKMAEEFIAKYEIIEKAKLALKENFEVIFVVFPLECVTSIKNELEGIENASR